MQYQLDEIGDTLFAVAMVAAIGFAAANLAVQVNKERGALEAAAASGKLGQLAYPPLSPHTGTDGHGTLPIKLNF